ncbi:hypothetical protein BDN67DRAFT_1012389 [Paxillus ammoniavirescens]|nr:hypothetical protein BDN67DRAFT_1012389 [Paxillus ammoniavirescens]
MSEDSPGSSQQMRMQKPQEANLPIQVKAHQHDADPNVPQPKDVIVELDDNHKNEDNNPEAEYQEI